MDAQLVARLLVGATILFAILAAAKDAEGKRYGVKKMALLWLSVVPYFLSSAVEFIVKHADGGTQAVKITYSTWFLVVLPAAIIADNIVRRTRLSCTCQRAGMAWRRLGVSVLI